MSTLNAARKAFVASSKSNGMSSNSYIGYIYRGEDNVSLGLKIIGGGPCHGYYAKNYLMGQPESKTIEYLIWSLRPLVMKEPLARQYYHWLFNESPWRNVFIVKDYDDAVANGILVDPNHSENLVISAAIASRWPTESYCQAMRGRYFIYEALLGKGYPVSEALMFSYMFSSYKDNNKFPVIFSRISSGHQIFNLQGCGEDYVRNFLTDNLQNLNPMTFKANRGYDKNEGTKFTANNLFGECTDAKDRFCNWVSRLTVKNASLAEDYNIFRVSSKKQTCFDTIDDLCNVIEQIKERVFDA